MATLAEIEKALAAAKENYNVGYDHEALREVEQLEEARRVAYLKELAEDSSVDAPFRDAARKEYNAFVSEAQQNPKKYTARIEKQNKVIGKYLDTSVKLDSLLPELPEAPKAEASTEPKPTAAPPAPASPPAPGAPKPAAPTPKAVKELDEDVKAMKAERLKQEELRTKRMDREVEEADKAADQREYNALTPAQKLERSVRSREQQQAANARGAVEARREQLAADEEYKGMQIASSGSFKRGDVTQYVDPEERAAAQSYFTARAGDLRSGTSNAGPAPTFSGKRSLAVMDIDPRYGGGKATGANPNFAGGAKFGPDPDTMASEMIGGKPVPIMTVGQAFATQSRGPGINQYEKAGTIPQQLDARSARGIRDVATKQMVDEQIEYALTGKLPPRLEEERRKKLQEEQRSKENAAINTGPANPRSQLA